MTLTEITNPEPERVIITQRHINQPLVAVYKAWTTPSILKNWWGPKGFTNTFNEFHLEPGGYWRFIMHGPDGKNYPNESQFVSITPLRKLVFNHITPPLFQVIASFEKAGDHATQVTFTMIFDTATTRQQLAPIVVPANEENFDRLEAVLQNM